MKNLSQYLMTMSLAGMIIFTFKAFAQKPSADEILKQAQTAAAAAATPSTNAPQAPANTPAPVTIPTPTPSAAVPGNVNKKLNLEDITVKGELLSDDRMNFVRRQREELKNRIKFRTNFRSEILQEYKN